MRNWLAVNCAVGGAVVRPDVPFGWNFACVEHWIFQVISVHQLANDIELEVKIL